MKKFSAFSRRCISLSPSSSLQRLDAWKGMLKISCKECFIHECENIFLFPATWYFYHNPTASICMLTESASTEKAARSQCNFVVVVVVCLKKATFWFQFKMQSVVVVAVKCAHIIILQLKYQSLFSAGKNLLIRCKKRVMCLHAFYNVASIN